MYTQWLWTISSQNVDLTKRKQVIDTPWSRNAVDREDWHQSTKLHLSESYVNTIEG